MMKRNKDKIGFLLKKACLLFLYIIKGLELFCPYSVPRTQRSALTRHLVSGLLVIFLSLITIHPCSATSNQDSKIQASYLKLPLHFEANQGQSDPSVKFLSRGSGYSLFLTSGEAVLSLRKSGEDSGSSSVLTMRLEGANPDAHVRGLDQLPGKINYFTGSDRSQWRADVPTYRKVQYQDIYPGIDLVYYGNQRQLEYDFVVAPGKEVGSISLAFDGMKDLRVDEEGDLVLEMPCGSEVRFHRPLLYQELSGAIQPVSGRYVKKSVERVGCSRYLIMSQKRG
jgi:hypothetical protein